MITPIRILMTFLGAVLVAMPIFARAMDKPPKILVCNGQLTGAGWYLASPRLLPEAKRQLEIKELWNTVRSTRNASPQTALDALERLAVLTPKDPLVFQFMGRLHYENGEPEKAVTEFRKALGLGRLETHLQTVFLKLILERPDLVPDTRDVDFLTRKFPKSPEIMVWAFKVYIARKQLHDAIRIIKNWQQKRPDEPMMLALKAELEGIKAVARELWNQARTAYAAGDMLSAKNFLAERLRLSVDPKADIWTVAAMIKIDLLGTFPASPILEEVLRLFGPEIGLQVHQMASRLDWRFIAAEIDRDSEPVSITNPFYNRLNDRPVNGHTARTTR